jgi:hypothetical protein
VAKQDRHLTTARLSAYIDGQLSAEEQAQSEEHLRTCELCQQQLAELRQIVSLLYALPQPQLPRSFTLPVAEPALAARVAPVPRLLAPVTSLRQKRGIPAPLGGAIRVISTLAAVIGIVFLLSGLFGTVIVLPSGGVRGSANSGSGGVTSASTPQKSMIPHFVTPRSTNISGQDVTPTPTNAPSVTSPGTTHNLPHQPNQPQLTILDILGSPWGRAIIGGVLVVLGIIGFVVVGRRI